jgi:hypothetical protein
MEPTVTRLFIREYFSKNIKVNFMSVSRMCMKSTFSYLTMPFSCLVLVLVTHSSCQVDPIWRLSRFALRQSGWCYLFTFRRSGV